MLLNIFYDAITKSKEESLENLLMLDFLFHKGTTLNGYLLLCRREIIRHKAYQHSKSFNEYVAYFKTASLLGIEIGQDIPYELKNLEENTTLQKDELTFSHSSTDYLMPSLQRASSQTSDIEEAFYVKQIINKENSITSSINEYYTDSVSKTLDYLCKAEKIIYEKFILKNKLKRFYYDYLSPLIDLSSTHKTSLFYNERNGLKNIIDWSEYTKRFLIKLFTINTIKIDVKSELGLIYKQLLLHKVKHKKKGFCNKPFISELNAFIQNIEIYSHSETIHTSTMSLSIEKTSLVKILWYICEQEEDLIHPFIDFISNVHQSDLTDLLQQLTYKQQKNALMIAITNNNYEAFKTLLSSIKLMEQVDIHAILNIKDVDGNNCLMIAAHSHPSYMSRILELNATLSDEMQKTLLIETNINSKNALMLAIENKEQKIEYLCSAIKHLEPDDINHIILQKDEHKFGMLPNLVINKPPEIWEVSRLFRHLDKKQIYTLLSEHIGIKKEEQTQKPENQDNKTPDEKETIPSKKNKKVVRSDRIIAKYAKEQKAKVYKNKTKNIFWYALSEHRKNHKSNHSDLFTIFLLLLNKLSVDQKEHIFSAKNVKGESVLHLAFSSHRETAKNFISYIKNKIPANNALDLLYQLDSLRNTPLTILAEHHCDLLESLISFFSSISNKRLLAALCKQKNNNGNGYNFLQVAILSQYKVNQYPSIMVQKSLSVEANEKALTTKRAHNESNSNRIKKILEGLHNTLPESEYCNLLAQKDGHNKSILIHALNTENKILFFFLIRHILSLKATVGRDKLIEDIVNFNLRYSVDDTYITITPLLECLNKAKNLKDLPDITNILNPNGWQTLFLSIANHPQNLIDNLKLYIVIKQSKLNIGEHSSLLSSLNFSETADYKLTVANTLLKTLEQNVTQKMWSPREIKVLKQGKLYKIIQAYNEKTKKDLLSKLRTYHTSTSSFWPTKPTKLKINKLSDNNRKNREKEKETEETEFKFNAF